MLLFLIILPGAVHILDFRLLSINFQQFQSAIQIPKSKIKMTS